MDMHLPVGGRRKWILVGPSMGSIVAQAYMTLHPDDVTGRDSAHDDENVSTLE
jgi:pimeloyl-ACP methyl ester carboxylesterase